MIDEINLRKIREIPIFDVCSKLGISLYGTGKLTRRAKCWYHDDKHPSMHVNKVKNIYKCFVCGKGGDVIKLVQDYENKTFPEACDWLVNEFDVILIEDKQPTAGNSSKFNSKLNNYENNFGTNFAQFDFPLRAVELNLPSEAGPLPSAFSPQPSSITPLPSDLVPRSLSLDSQFCKSVVSAGYLTDSQLRHAAARYRLGRSKDGGVIFWQIDDQQRVRTGKIMYYQPDCHRDKEHHPTWVHALMKDSLPSDYDLRPCLFGLHLLTLEQPTTQIEKLNHPDPLMGRGYLSERATGGAVKPPNIGGGLAGVDASFSSFLRAEEKDNPQEKDSLGNKGVAIVESEKTAIILSEKFPDFIWLSCGGLQMFKPELLEPLLQHRIIIFPDTDPQGEAFCLWTQVALDAQRLYKFRYPLRVSPLLEQHATPEQKEAKIDLVDFLFK